ncbi:MAG: hypothetical protein ABIK44_01020 [candidate division WOR-3 bacterium]
MVQKSAFSEGLGMPVPAEVYDRARSAIRLPPCQSERPFVIPLV